MSYVRAKGCDRNRNSIALGMEKALIVKVAQSCPTLCDTMDCSPCNSPSQNTGVGSLSLLQGIFPTQGSNSGLPHCRQILYQLSHTEAEEINVPIHRGFLLRRVCLANMWPSSPCVCIASPLHTCLCPKLLLQGHWSYWTRTHSSDLS